MRSAVFFLLALLGTSLGVPAGQRNTCADHCDASNIFAYESGKSYVYEYSVTTSTALLETFDDDAHMHITAHAHIDVSAPCEYILRLTDVNLDGSSHGPDFAAAVTKSPLRFSFEDGRIDNICSEPSEPVWVINFKRGLLSTFQNSMTHYGRQDIKETDISGVCSTHFNSTVEGSTVIIDKITDLASCTQRPDHTAFIPSTGYITDSPVQSLPIFSSTNECHQRVEEGILKMVECEEIHVFRPFSSEKGGAVTTAKTSMILLSQEQSSPVADFEFNRNTLVFEQTHTTEAQIEAVEEILNNLNTASESEIRPEVPALFAKLVTSLKELNYPQLNTVFTNAKETHTRKFLADAMPLVGTAAAFGVVRDMFINGDITEFEADMFFTSLAFFKNPTSEMFTALAPMLENNPSQKALLGTSALINTFCKYHEDCQADSGVQQIIRLIETQLGSGCRTVNEEEKFKVLVALKALGNAGRWVNANSILRRCYTEDNDMEVRVAAIEAWRHTPCDYDYSHLLAAFEDESQDTEIRIASYLALMTCPNQDLINTIKDRLTSEGVNQVGSFIWTHMTNMQESAAPEKQWIRQLIGEELLQKKFSTEALKFSRNYESSFFMNEINTGATVESNVIFSSKSYLPRSAMFNLTLDLFGQSINFFEVGGRIEGFEAYIERFFGPRGYYPEETIESVIRNMRQNSDADATTLEGFLDKITDEPEGSYYLRVFGNELHYHHFKGIENLIQTSGASNLLEFFMDMARKGEVDYTKSYQLMDIHHTVPTIAGLPVSLTAKGTATLGLQMNGKFKANSLRNVNIEGHLHPSAAVHIDGLMIVDAHVTHTGLKMSSNLHTSTLIDGKLQIAGGKVVDVAINTPKDKMEVISVKTEFFYLEDDQEIRKEVENLYEAKGCSSGTIGVAVCGEFGFTPRSHYSPAFPFSGPFATKVYLEKTDTHTGYIFHFSNEQNHITFEFDTPESQSNHKIGLDITKSGNKATFNILTPFKSAQGEGEFIWQRNNKNIKASINIDGSGQYSLDAGFNTARNGLMKFEPHVVLVSPSGELLNLQSSFEGKFDYSESFVSSKIDVEYDLWQGGKQAIHHAGLLKREGDEYEDEEITYKLQLKLDSSEFPIVSVDIDAESKISSNMVQTSAKLMYPYFAIDSMVTQELEFAMNYLKTKSVLSIQPGKEYTIILHLEKEGYMDVKGTVNANFNGFISSLDAAFHGTDDAHYKLQVNGAINGENYGLEATLENNSVPGKINGLLDGKVTTPQHNAAVHLGVYADKDKAHGDLKSTVNGREYSVMVETTRTSILVDANIIRHIYIDAKVTSTTDMQKLLVSAEWDKDVDPTKSFIIDGLFSTEEVHGIIRYGQTEVSTIAKLIDNGLELETKWAADKRIFVNIHYTLGNTKSLAATVQTPFSSWEKQDVSFTFSLKDYEVESHFAATWMNTEQLAFSATGKVEPGLFTNAFTTKITFTSAFDNFERITFLLDHNMVDSAITTHTEGAWNQQKMEGNLHITPNANGVEARATFTSPITENILVTLHHELLDKQLSTKLEMTYGQEISTATITGHVDLGEIHDIALEFKAVTPVAAIPEINASLKYSLSGESLNFITEGKMGEKKIMLNANGQMTVSGDNTDISGDLRFITPFMYPITANLKHTHDLQHFTSQFEMTRFWSTYGDVKIHAQGHMMSKNDIELKFALQSPVIQASASLNHKISQDNILTSSATVTVNGEKISISANGHVDMAKQVADLQAEITSTNIGISGSHDVETMPFSAKAVITFNSKDYQIDELDNLALSGMYDFRNEKKVTLKLTRASQEINLSGRLEEQTLVFEGTTPFSGWEKLDASFFISSSAIKAFASRNDRKIEVTGTLHMKRNKAKVNLVINTPYAGYETIEVDANYNFQRQEKTVEFKATFASQELSLKGYIKTNNILAPEMTLNIITPFEAVNTLGGEAHWDLRNAVKTAEVKAFRNDRHYHWELEAAADSPLKGYAKSKITTPIAGWTTVNMEGNFDFTSVPYKFMYTLDKEGVVQTFEGHATLDNHKIVAEVSTPITNWEKIALNGFENLGGEYTLDYDTNNHKLQVTLLISQNSNKWNFSAYGHYDDDQLSSWASEITFEATTPFNHFQNISLKIKYDMNNKEDEMKHKPRF
ncbi:beta-1,3-glucan-binding protein precursor [Penaeus vannamei]|uniref:Beta-1,3-glucan-binding protein n=1 Tax=Penaeus vannamei TaxID=6689 RepID=A0A3R7MV24_PENVA|nr:beta-1,3-glucan-binding protein precursor [Penaeus vannamei]